MKKTLLLLCSLAALCAGPAGLATPCRARQDAGPAASTQAGAGQIESLLKESVRQMFAAGKIEDAVRSAEAALALSREAGDLAQQLRAANLLALSLFRAGRTAEAVRRYEEAAGVAERAGDAGGQGLALTRAANLLRVSARYDEALDLFGRAVALYRRGKNARGEALALGTLSTVYSETGDFERARQQLRQAMSLASGLNDRVLDRALLLKLGIVERESGDAARALALGLQALALDSEQEHEAVRREERRTLEQTLEAPQAILGLTRIELMFHLGSVHAALGDHRQSAAFYERALDISRERRRPLVFSVLLGNLAGARLRLGEAEKARELATRALELLRRSGGSLHWESIFLHHLAEAERALGRDGEALTNYRRAVEAVERARTLSIPTEVSRAGIVAARHDVFAGAIDFLLTRGRGEEALEVAEAWHARAFLDVLTESRVDLGRDLTAGQREQEDGLFARISGLQKELWGQGLAPAREQELKSLLAGAEQELESFQLAMRRANPRYAEIKYARPLKAEQVARGFPGPEAALVEFVLGERRSFAWVVRSGKVSAVTLPPRREIEELAGDYRAVLSERVSALTFRNARARTDALGAALYEKLFAPLEKHLAGARTLVIVPDGALSYLPFEALAGGAESRYLVERYTVSYAPSATALAAIREAAGGAHAGAKGLIAFGDPAYAGSRPAAAAPDSRAVGASAFNRLPYTRAEVNAIASLFDAAERRTFLGAEAREERVKSEDLGAYRYVHFAAHGMIDERFPARSGIALALAGDSREDGVLQMGEVMRLKLRAELVTLSACRTGLGRLTGGEGLIGLTRAFHYAGTPAVVASLWNVNDAATADLMKSFYQNLRAGLPKDEALRRAKLQLLRGKSRHWEHPYFWASFVLVGAGT